MCGNESQPRFASVTLGWELPFLPVSCHQPFGFLEARTGYHGSFRKQLEIASEDLIESTSILPNVSQWVVQLVLSFSEIVGAVDHHQIRQ